MYIIPRGGQQQHHQEEQSSQSLGTNATATSTKEIISLLPKCNESVKNNEVPDLIENIALHFRQTGRPGYLHQTYSRSAMKVLKITVRTATTTSTKKIISLLPKCNESVKITKFLIWPKIQHYIFDKQDDHTDDLVLPTFKAINILYQLSLL
ncbi:hypothetical protein RIR_jg21803.t2 [Rhizophagus irregularis DAOM 181602=DAOM 197198]|nr:hypothetical protein RIR_jg21803.t2 [Rhizophagus irregularis DAOM 181602=DAOM 197198]